MHRGLLKYYKCRQWNTLGYTGEHLTDDGDKSGFINTQMCGSELTYRTRMIQSRITTMCVLLEKKNPRRVYTHSQYLLLSWTLYLAYVHNTTTTTGQTLQVFYAFIEQRIERAQMVSGKEAEDLVNRHEQTQNINVCNC